MRSFLKSATQGWGKVNMPSSSNSRFSVHFYSSLTSSTIRIKNPIQRKSKMMILFNQQLHQCYFSNIYISSRQNTGYSNTKKIDNEDNRGDPMSISLSKKNKDKTSEKNKTTITLRDHDNEADSLKINHDVSMEVEKNVADGMSTVRSLHQRGLYHDALETSLSLSEYIAVHYGEDHPVMASCMSNIALFSKLLGKLDDALHWYSKAVYVYKVVKGEDDRSYLTTLNNLGNVYLIQGVQTVNHGKKLDAYGSFQSAEETFRHVLDGRMKLFSHQNSMHPEILTTKSNIASVFIHTDRLLEAQNSLEEVLLPEDYEELKSLYMGAEENKEADISSPVLKQNEGNNNNKSNNVGYITVMNNLGFIYKKREFYASAILAYQKALDIHRALGTNPQNPEMIMLMNNMAECYKANGKEAEALQLQEEILKQLEP